MAHVHGSAANGAAHASTHAAHLAHGAHAAHAAHGAAHTAHAAASHAMVAQAAKAAPAAVSFHNVAKGAAATGAVAAVGGSAGKSLVGRFFSHPLVLFGLGFAVGYAVHKYRKEIIEAANDAAERSKDFVLQQRENLEDIVSKTQEPEN